jgi:hypothetical protein
VIDVGLICLACALLSLSLRRHYQQVFADIGGYERRVWPLRLLGYGCLALALWPCVRLSGPWVGSVLWVSLSSLGAFLQAMLLSYFPRIGALSGAVGLALVALGLLP